MKKIMFIFLCFLFCTCKRQPKIPISNTLEIALGNRYSEYVNLLNKATKKDTIALLQFLKINYINDAAGYDHGYILYQLMGEVGEKEYAASLQKMNTAEINNFRQYLEVGIDGNNKAAYEYANKYPVIRSVLQKEKKDE